MLVIGRRRRRLTLTFDLTDRTQGWLIAGNVVQSADLFRRATLIRLDDDLDTGFTRLRA